MGKEEGYLSVPSTHTNENSFFNRIYANSYNSISDIRLKENIKPLAKPLAKILKLNGVQFNWKDDKKGSKKENIGLIAQDVEKVFPEVVSTDKNGMKSVEYANLVAPLIEAIKEQQKEIETLRAEVEALKKKR
ncbi:MAG: tail fiber domain-containing protein [Deltaproteobacteria bacterium]|nr:tail fiber domain-containing protein [Deltaproteobacteria bacterium]